MKNINIPTGYNQVMPYLILKNASGFIAFAKEVFGAVEGIKHMREEQVIMHAEISIGTSVIMLADATDEYSVSNSGMFVYVADADASFEKALKLGATSITPMSDQPYGRSGGIKDPFGNTWWVTSANE